nr:hypothetical protein [Tanacetum cinerariifolium]
MIVSFRKVRAVVGLNVNSNRCNFPNTKLPKNYVVGWLSLTNALAEPTENTILRTRVLSATVAAVVRA